jgi:PadR family transcriptional regulator PadR
LSNVDKRNMNKSQTDLLQGTLDLLVLKTLQSGPTHGWDIAQRIQQVSQDVLRVGQGSLYPALHRLEARGWIASEWGASEANRRAKFYKLTPAGRKRLADETMAWQRFAAAVALILETP